MQNFGLVNVPPRVHDNYSSCGSLMLPATKAYICAAFMAWAGTTDTATSPSWVNSTTKRNSAVQWESLQIQIGKFVDGYVLTEFDNERAWQEQLEQQCQQKENERTSTGNDDEMTAISYPAQQPYSSGSVVILLQKSEDYKVLAVGKVVEVDAHISVPEKHVPVFVASIDECASAILAPANVVFWPTDLLAVYKSPTKGTAETSQTSSSSVNSNISDIPPGSEEDRYLNYGLQAKPFQYQRGRTLHSFPNVTKSPLDHLDVALLNTWLTNHKRKLFTGIHDCNDEDNDEDNELSNGDENTPEDDDLDD